VSQSAARLREAQKLGFTKAIGPEVAGNEVPEGFALSAIATLDNLVVNIARDSGPGLRRVGRQEA
jgi:DNA repair protein RadA/Sms